MENGEAYFPAVFEAVRHARSHVLIEVFILLEDKVGRALHEALIKAAERGVKVDLLVDGFGAPDLSSTFIEPLTKLGVTIRVFDPGHSIFGQRLNLLRRMHRKIVVVDKDYAFVGGINFSADHLMDFGTTAKQDYAVKMQGPIVEDIRRFVLQGTSDGTARKPKRKLRLSKRTSLSPDARFQSSCGADVLLVTRDNNRHPDDIEHHYRAAIRGSRRRIVIANAYFFPGYLLIRDLRAAARRGVDVQLILQGEPDVPIAQRAARTLYHHLTNAGVKIHEYCERPMHGKVALVDDQWCTVGSSNLDPLSLALNLEANVVVYDHNFNRALSDRLEALTSKCNRVSLTQLGEWRTWRLVRSFFVFHFLRWYPSWLSWLPQHVPRIRRMK